MTRLRLPLSLALLCVLVATTAPGTASATSASGRMVAAINSFRNAHGLSSLHTARSLRRSGGARARKMIRYDFFAHPSRLRVPRFNYIGEVLELHGGRRAKVRRTLRNWKNSPGHRSVLLSSTYRQVGAARASGWYRGHRATIWVVRVGRR